MACRLGFDGVGVARRHLTSAAAVGQVRSTAAASLDFGDGCGATRSTAPDAGGGGGNGGSTGDVCARHAASTEAERSTLVSVTHSPTSLAQLAILAHLPHCTHRCRPETRDGLSTSRLETLWDRWLPRGAPLRRVAEAWPGRLRSLRGARGAQRGEPGGSKRWQLRSHAEHEGLGSGWQTPHTPPPARPRSRRTSGRTR